MCHPWNRLQAQTILVHVPEKRCRPFIQTIYRRLIADIVDQEILMLCRIICKHLVHPVHIPGSAVKIRTILISHQTVIGKFKVILNDRTMPGIRQLLPHHLKMFKFRSELVLHLFPGILYLRQTAQVSKARMNINQIRSKRVQFFIAEHRIFPVHSVLRFIKGRFNSLIQQKQLQNPDNIMGRRASQHRDLLRNPLGVLLQQTTLQAF